MKAKLSLRFRALLVASVAIIITARGTSGQCDPQWTHHNGFCYFLNQQQLDFDQARAYCAQQNAYIVDIQSSSEQSFVSAFYRTRTNAERGWIGYNDIATEGTFVWERTGNSGTYRNWDSGEPNNLGGEDCAQLRLSEPNPDWNDVPCTLAYIFVCKKEMSENVQVNCTSQTMSFHVRKAYYDASIRTAAELSLNDRTCRPIDQGSRWYMSWSLSQCGNVVTQNGNRTTYTNTLQSATSSTAIITRSHGHNLTVSCTFDKNLIVSSGGLLPQIFQPRTVTEEGFGQYTLRLDITDGSYSNRITIFPLTVQLREQIYFHLSVHSTAPLDIFAVRCYATPEESPASIPQYNFLTEDCPQDPTLFINSSSSESMKFSMEAFRFLGDYQHVYAHCEVIVCHASQSDSRCSQGCLTSKRRKRRQAANGEFFVGGSSKLTLSQGPFTRATTSTRGPEQGGKSSGTRSKTVISIFPAMVTFVAQGILSRF